MNGRLGRLAQLLTIVGVLSFWLVACGETDTGARDVAPPSVNNPCPPTEGGDATGGNVIGPGGGSTGESGGISQPGTDDEATGGGESGGTGGTTGEGGATGGTTGESGTGGTTGEGGTGNGGSSGQGGGTSSGATGSDPANENATGNAAPCATPGQ